MKTRLLTHVPTGDLTIFEVAEFRDALITFLSHEERGTMDLSKLGRLDTSGIQLIIAARRSQALAITGITQELQGKLNQLGDSGHTHVESNSIDT